MISPKICHCIHYRNMSKYVTVSTTNTWDTKYVTVSKTWAIKDTVTSYFTKCTLCSALLWVCLQIQCPTWIFHTCSGLTFGLLTAVITKFTSGVRVLEPLALLGGSYLAYVVAELFHWYVVIFVIHFYHPNQIFCIPTTCLEKVPAHCKPLFAEKSNKFVFDKTNFSCQSVSTRPVHKNLFLEFPEMPGSLMLHVDR